jgi:putative membrane protein
MSSSTPTPRSRRRTKIAIIGLAALAIVLTPLAINGLFTGALSHADTNISSVPAAIVNNDKMTTSTAADGTQTTNFAGRGLVTQLTGSTPTGFDWTVTNSADAQKGLDDGTYYAVLTIPEDFSSTLNTLGTANPQQGLIDITTDDSHGYLSGIVASTVASAVQAGFGQQVTAQIVNGIYTSFGGVAGSLSTAAGGATQLASGAGGLATGANQLADGLTQYTGGVSSLSDGLDQLQSGTAQVGQLADGITDYTSGVSSLSDGYGTMVQALAQDPTLSPTALATLQGFGQRFAQVAGAGAPLAAGASGLADLPSGVAQLADGADQLAANGPALVSGAQQLGTGATQLGTGATQLATGLQSGADQLKANSSSDPSSAAKVIAQPVKVNVTTVNQVTNVGQIVSTIILPAALWIGALALFLWLRPFSKAVLASSASTARLTARTFVRASGIAAAQVVLLVAFLHLALGVAWSSLPATLGFSLIVALAFTAFHQFLTTAFGRVGAVISLVLFAVQIAATGGLYPVQILSGPFQVISALSPLTYAVSGIQGIITGGDPGTVVASALVMAGVLLASLLLSGVALGRRRRPVEIGWVVPVRRASRRSKPAPVPKPRLA